MWWRVGYCTYIQPINIKDKWVLGLGKWGCGIIKSNIEKQNESCGSKLEFSEITFGSRGVLWLAGINLQLGLAWDQLGSQTGELVLWYFFLTGKLEKHNESESVSPSVMSDSLWPHRLQSTRLLSPWNSPGKNTGVGCHSLIQETFLTWGSNSGFLRCRQILYHLSHQGSP